MAKVVKSVGRAIGKVFKVVGNFVGMLFSPPKVPKASANVASEARLNVTLVPEEPRKIVFGETALGTDLRFWETFGAKNERHVQVIASAGHAIESFGNLYIDEIPVPLDPYAPLPGNKYYQALGRYTVTKGDNFGFSFGSGTRWNASATLWGCAYFVLDWVYSQEKLTNGIPSRITQVGKGAKVYDPRRDSTRGGSGSHRANNPDTWEYAPLDSNGKAIGRNNALQMLTYQLGLFIKHRQKNEWVLVGGRGVDPDDIDFNSFIVAANYCEVYGWYSDCVLSTGDSHSTNEGILEAASGGELVDVGGRFSYYVAADDTANAVVFLDENDIVGPIDWEPQPSLSEQFNELPGTFVDPAALFQTRPLPMAWDQAYYDEDGYKKRGGEMKLSAVQDPVQGQKLLRIALNRSRFPGVFSAPFNRKALKVQKHSLVRFSFTPFGWVDKLFRVEQQGIAETGGVQLVLKEEHASIYQPGTVVAVPPPSASYGGDRNIKIAVAGLTTVATGIESGTRAVDAIRVSWATDDQRILHTEVRFRQTSDADWQTSAPLRQDIKSAVISPLFPTTQYEIQVRHISIWNVPGDWASALRTTDAVTKNPVTGAITYADGTPIDDLKPAGPNANNTQANISAGFAGQGALATQNAVTWASQVTGVGKPANDATKSRVFVQMFNNPPSGQTVNDIWVKTNASGTALSVAAWNGSAWIDGGNVTEFFTAQGITGQGPGATAPAHEVMNNALFGPGENRVAFSEFEKATFGWVVMHNPAALPVSLDFNDWMGKKFGKFLTTFAATSQQVSFGTSGLSRFRVTPGERLAVSIGVELQGPCRVHPVIRFYNESGASIGEAVIRSGLNSPTAYDTKCQNFITVPAGAFRCGFEIYMIATGSGVSSIALTEPMVMSANAAQVLFPPFVAGPNAVGGADITADNTAGGIIGQGPGATAPGTDILNQYLPLGANQIVNSAFERGEYGWGRGGIAANRGTNYPGYWGVTNTAYVNVGGVLAAGSAVGAMYTVATQNLENIRRFAMPVAPGQKVFVSIFMGTHRCRGRVNVHWFRADGTGYPAAESFTGGRELTGSSGGAINGDPANMERVGGFSIAPADAKYAMLSTAMIGTGGDNPFYFYTRGMLCILPLGQTEWPVYQAGPSDPIADKTNDNVAGGIIGQSPDATVSYAGNTYANDDAAIAAGRAVGWIYWNSTTNSRKAVAPKSSGSSSGVKSLQSGPGGSVADGVVSGVAAGSNLRIYGYTTGGSLTSNGTLYGIARVFEESGGVSNLLLQQEFQVTAQGELLPNGQWPVSDSSAWMGEASGTRSGTVTYRVEIQRTGGAQWGSMGAVIHTTIVITPPI